MTEVKVKLDRYYNEYHKGEFIEKDPVQFVHRYEKLQDIEIVALLTSTIAWGRRDMILRSCERVLGMMGNSPYDYVMEERWRDIDESANIHRTFFGRDLMYMCRGLKLVYERHESMEDIFVGVDTWEGIGELREELAAANEGKYSRHVSNPDKSACKRLHMMLRWLCRQGSMVDVGVWKRVDMGDLKIPLDVHVARVSTELGLTKRKANDRKTVEEITSALKRMCPEDPIKYDFALFGYGVNS